MKKIYYIFMIAVLGWTTTGCGDFLDENPTSKVYVNSIDDINELILGECYMSPKMPAHSNMEGDQAAIPGWIHVMDDDTKMNNNSASSVKMYGAFAPFHYWMSNPCIKPNTLQEYEDYAWIKLYKHINALNVILYELDSRFSAEQTYARYKGEVLFLRGLYYFYLVNLYGLPYNPANGGSDLGVVVKLTEVVEDVNFSRSTVAEVYDVILRDLKEAATLLKGVSQKSIYRPDEYAVHHLMSRVYLYTCQWDECIKQCDLVLGSQYSLSDFRSMGETDSRITKSSPEVIFSNGENRLNAIFRGCSKWTGGSGNAGGTSGSVTGAIFKASDELVALFDRTNDTRFGTFEFVNYRYKSGMQGYYPTFKLKQASDGLVSDCCTFRLAEIYLNKAEALLMKGAADGETTAKALIKTLRDKRFVSGSNYELTSSGTALLNDIRDERRRELFFEGHRWFDLRRYAVSQKEPLNKRIVHYVDKDRDGIDDGHFILKPFNESDGAGNWVMRIPAFEVEMCEGALKDNNRYDAPEYEGIDVSNE